MLMLKDRPMFPGVTPFTNPTPSSRLCKKRCNGWKKIAFQVTVGPEKRRWLVGDARYLNVSAALLVGARQVDVRIRHAISCANIPGRSSALKSGWSDVALCEQMDLTSESIYRHLLLHRHQLLVLLLQILHSLLALLRGLNSHFSDLSTTTSNFQQSSFQPLYLFGVRPLWILACGILRLLETEDWAHNQFCFWNSKVLLFCRTHLLAS